MEDNINIGPYTIPLDCIDFSLKQFQNTVSRSDKPRPIWSADKYDDNYYEFTVYGETTVHQEIDDSISKANNNKTPCYICNIDVPTSYIERHTKTDHHKTCMNISENAVCRLQKQAVNTIFLTNTETNHYFCETCSIVINKNEITQHLATKLHQLNEKYEETIKDFAKVFIDKGNFMKKLEKEISIMMMKDQKKSDVEKADRVDENSNKADRVDEHPRRFDKVAENSHKADENSLKLDRFVAYSESRKSSISSESNFSEMSENKTALKALQDYFKHIKFSNMTITVDHYYGKCPGVTLNFYDGTEIKSTLDNFHGFNGEGISLQCRVCRVMVGNRTEHIYTSQHMQRIQEPLTAYCIRQLDSVWYHCILCNDFLENIDVHVKNPDHISRVNQCLTRDIAAFAPSAATSKGYCKYCDVALPHGKAGKSFRKSHNKTVKHKYEKWLARKDKKLHYMMCKNNNDPYVVICIACGYSVRNHKEDIEDHINSMDHELQYKRLLDNNFVTITSDMLALCNICGTDILFFEIIAHISKKIHKRKVAEQVNVIQTQVFEANRNISQNSTETKTKVPDFENQTAVFGPTKTITNISDNKNLFGVEKKTNGLKSPIKDDKSFVSSELGNTAQSNQVTSVTTKQPIPATTARYEDWLRANNFTRVEDNLYHCVFCEIFVSKKALFDHSMSSIHQTALSGTWIVSNGSTNCETCELKVPNIKDCITQHINGKKHSTKLAQQLPNSIQDCKDHNAELNPQVLNKDEAVKDKLNVKDNYYTENIKTAQVKDETSHLFKAPDDKDIKTTQNNNENASSAPPSTSKQVKVEPNETAANIKTSNLAKLIFFKQNTDTEVSCLLCTTKVLNTESNISEHLNGKIHTKNLKLVDDDDSMILYKKSYYCAACSTHNTLADSLDHIKTKKHQDAFKIPQNHASTIPLAILSTSTHVKEETKKTAAKQNITDLYGLDHIKTKNNQDIFKIPQNNKSTGSLAIPLFALLSTPTHVEEETKKTAAKQNITDLDDFKMFIKKIGTEVHCRLCATKIPDTVEDITDHLKGKLHYGNLKIVSDNNVIPHNKSAYFCNVCSAPKPIPDILQHIQTKKHQSAMTTATETKAKASIQQQPTSNERTDIESVDKGAFCEICSVYTGKGVSIESHNNVIQHKRNEQALNCPNRFQMMASNHPFVTKPNSDKTYCTICDKHVRTSRIEKHILLKSHADRLLDENLQKHTNHSFIECLRKNEIYDNGDNNFHCRLCKISFQGRWRAEIHILEQTHLILLEKHNQRIGTSHNNASLGRKNENATPDQLNQATTSKELKREKVDFYPFKSVEENSGRIFAGKPYIKDVTPRSGQESVNSPGIDNCSEIDDEDRVEFEHYLPEQRGAESSDNDNQDRNKAPVTIISTPVENQTNIAATIVKNIPEFFEKTERPSEIYCLFCKVIVPFNDSNIESHVRGAKHIARRWKQSDGNQSEILKANNKIIKGEQMLAGDFNSEKFNVKTSKLHQENEFQLLKHIETNIHKSHDALYISDLDKTKQNQTVYRPNIKLSELSRSQEQFKIASRLTGNTICCRVCKLSYKSDDEYRAHLDKSAHQVMLEVMLSANSIKYPYKNGYAFCQLCKTCETPIKLLDHIEGASHKIKLLDGLKNMGKQMFTLIGHSFPQLTKTNVLKVPDEVLNHLMVLAKDNVVEVFFCNLCNMKMLKKHKAAHEARSHPELVTKHEELH